MALPLAYLLLRATDANTETWNILLRPRTLQILLRSLFLVLAVTSACIAIALPLAWLTVRTDLPLRRVWAVLTFLPLVIPSYVGAFLVVLALGPRGMLQGWLAPLGVERLPEIYGFPGATLTLSLLSYPYVLLPVRAALLRLDPSLEEAARGLGHGPWRTFWHVTFPLLRPAIAAGALLVALYTLSDFGAVSLLRYETFTWAIYLQYGSFDRNAAGTLALAPVVVAFGLLALEAAGRSTSRYHRSGSGAARSPARISLGRWRWPAVGFCAAVVLLALVMPLAVLTTWAAQGTGAGEALQPLAKPAFNSLLVSILGAVAALAAALPVAVLTVRFPGRLSALVERLSHTGFALPGIVVALSLVFFGINFARPLYQTLGLLLFAYVVLFFPVAMGAVRASLLQVSPRLEEAARGLGRSPYQVLRTITLPLLRPGVLAGGALVFLVTMKELPATLILSPTGFTTLATATWGAASEALFAQAAVPALLLVLVSSLIMSLVVLPEQRGR
jgi:iron(III) transport system permease protein